MLSGISIPPCGASASHLGRRNVLTRRLTILGAPCASARQSRFRPRPQRPHAPAGDVVRRVLACVCLIHICLIHICLIHICLIHI